MSCLANVPEEFRGNDAKIQGCNGKTLRLFTRGFDPIDGRPLPFKDKNISRRDWRDVCSDINTCTFLTQLHSSIMAHRVHKCRKELEALKKVKDCKQKRNRIIDEAGKDLIQCICDCVLNVLNGNIELKYEEKKRLERHKDCLRELVKKKTSDKKRKHLIQEGGFLEAIIPTLVGLVGRLFGGQ